MEEHSSLEVIKLYVEIIEPILTFIGVVIAGIWGYRKFIWQREKEPATEIDMDVKFIGIQDEKWIIEITAYLENKGLVRQKYEDFILRVRYIERNDEVIDGDEKLNYQLYFPKSTDSEIQKEGENKKRREFHNADFINPKMKFRHRYITSIPKSASFIWIQGKFKFIINRKEAITNSQRIFRVPASEEELLELIRK